MSLNPNKIKILTHFSLENPKQLIGKQRSSRPDAGIWSGSTLFFHSIQEFL